MPFDLDGFITTEAYAGAVGGTAIREHRYATNDTKAQIQVAGYFNTLRDRGLIGLGDIVIVAGDRDGTPFLSSYIFASVPATGNVTMTEHAAVTQNVKNVLTVRVPVLGTASTQYVVVPFAGSITRIDGVSSANGATATGTITVTVPTTGAIATVPFLSSYTAGARVGSGSITAHTLAAGAVVTVATDGGGDGTGEVILTLELTPS